MYVGLREVGCCAVASDSSADACKNGYRFGFWATTLILAKNRYIATQNGLVRGLARRRRFGCREQVLPARRGDLHREQRPSSAFRRAGATSTRRRFLVNFALALMRHSYYPKGPNSKTSSRCALKLGRHAPGSPILRPTKFQGAPRGSF